MDRRQRKTREAIFEAFTKLLSEKSFNQITVGEIIKEADIGRATFYAHFETKDFLLKELCEELFCHIFDSMNDEHEDHRHIFSCDAPNSVFLHLLQHLQHNDNHILDLLSCQNDQLFLSYFKSNMVNLIENQIDTLEIKKPAELPKEYWINHITSTFVETVRWWIDNKMQQTPEVINQYFLTTMQIKN